MLVVTHAMIHSVIALSYFVWWFATCQARMRYRKMARICTAVDISLLPLAGVSLFSVLLFCIPDLVNDYPRKYLDD
jgi:hypothetical protein